MATQQTSQNPMRRQLIASSPIHIPFAFNLIILLITACFAMYNYTESPSIENVTEAFSKSTLLPL